MFPSNCVFQEVLRMIDNFSDSNLENTNDLTDILDTLALPNVEKALRMGWFHELPPALFVAFETVALTDFLGLIGESQWKGIEDVCTGALRYKPTPRQQEYLDKFEPWFKKTYGGYEKTPAGLVKCLIDLGLVVKGQLNKEARLYIPDVLPEPFSRIGIKGDDSPETGMKKRLSRLRQANSEEPITVIHAKRRNQSGDVDGNANPATRVRVMMDDLPELQRMLDLGWARHLPVELAAMYLIIAAVSKGKCRGRLMWNNIKDLYSQGRRAGPPYFPPPMRKEVAKRFAEEYGKPHRKSVRGSVQDLIDLGLVVKYQEEGEDVLMVPEVLPSPDTRLNLSPREKQFLEERKVYNAMRDNKQLC